MNDQKIHPAYGWQWTAGIYDYPNISPLRSLEILVEAAKAMNATIFGEFHTEIPSEKVAYVVLGESHIFMHDFKTGFALLDMMTCGEMNMQAGFDYIKQQTNFTKYKLHRERWGFDN